MLPSELDGISDHPERAQLGTESGHLGGSRGRSRGQHVANLILTAIHRTPYLTQAFSIPASKTFRDS